MNRSKLIAVITGAISIILAIAYLVIVQLLDFRGEMLLPKTYRNHLWQLPISCQISCMLIALLCILPRAEVSQA